ncbi:MAG: YggS family pyridoxal phosphate-dependent enzyme [Myxococcota bacterium]
MTQALLDRYQRVVEQIAEAALTAGRDPSDVNLIAVSKTHPLEMLTPLVDAGQRDFGESYAQELRDKGGALSGQPVRWHFIGRLQSNKARYIAPHAFRVHALETVRQAEALVARAPHGIDALVAVNVGREAQKSGVLPEALPDQLAALSGVQGLRLRGLMCLPPWSEDPEASAPFFEELAHLAAQGRAAGHALTELSMGMSADAHVAVRYGATWVRVGTAIFGPRASRA